jgi:hypothetical protein
MSNAIALTVAVIVGLGVLAFVGLHLYAYAWIWLDGVRLRRSLRRRDRTLTLKEARGRIGSGQGMIIVDAPALGWNVVRVWWSPVRDFASRPDSWQGDRLGPPEDDTNYRRLIDPSVGVAKLVDSFVFTQRAERFVARHFGTSRPGFVFSAGVIAEERNKARRVDPVAAPNSRPPQHLPSSPDNQSSDSLRTPPSGGCG